MLMSLAFARLKSIHSFPVSASGSGRLLPSCSLIQSSLQTWWSKIRNLRTVSPTWRRWVQPPVVCGPWKTECSTNLNDTGNIVAERTEWENVSCSRQQLMDTFYCTDHDELNTSQTNAKKKPHIWQHLLFIRLVFFFVFVHTSGIPHLLPWTVGNVCIKQRYVAVGWQ